MCLPMEPAVWESLCTVFGWPLEKPLGTVVCAVVVISYKSFNSLKGPLSFDSSGHPVNVRTTVEQYRVQPSGKLARESIGETNFTSNRVEFTVSTEEIFPGKDRLGSEA